MSIEIATIVKEKKTMAIGKVRKYTPKLNNIQKRAYQNALKIATAAMPQASATLKKYPKKQKRATATFIGR